ncbi:MAG: hypothetical protein JRH18_10130 [Deltaproteobacteria bacterium]|nr:hypothetical protein [Deltaproteobacteria bacterium]MBW1960169.1 hypothetical protein [Deltaproteobacteria bacterium]MBW2152012.1 hypothetical protein [Deltaproteobacteria bacterium]
MTTELSGKKVLIFSYFKDTARYVYRYLRENEDLKSAVNRSTRIIDSDVPTDQRQALIERFAPRANL